MVVLATGVVINLVMGWVLVHGLFGVGCLLVVGFGRWLLFGLGTGGGGGLWFGFGLLNFEMN